MVKSKGGGLFFGTGKSGMVYFLTSSQWFIHARNKHKQREKPRNQRRGPGNEVAIFPRFARLLYVRLYGRMGCVCPGANNLIIRRNRQ